MPSDPLEQLRIMDVPVRPRIEFTRGLGDRIREELTPFLVVLGGADRPGGTVTVRTTDVAPSLSYRDAHVAIAWLVDVLGFSVVALFEDPDGSVVHARLAWRTGAINLSTRRDGGRMPATGRSSVVLTAPDVAAVEELYRQALATGAEVLVPIEDTPYGSRGFSLADPEGHLWNVGTPWLDSAAARRLPQRRI